MATTKKTGGLIELSTEAKEQIVHCGRLAHLAATISRMGLIKAGFETKTGKTKTHGYAVRVRGIARITFEPEGPDYDRIKVEAEINPDADIRDLQDLADVMSSAKAQMVAVTTGSVPIVMLTGTRVAVTDTATLAARGAMPIATAIAALTRFGTDLYGDGFLPLVDKLREVMMQPDFDLAKVRPVTIAEKRREEAKVDKNVN